MLKKAVHPPTDSGSSLEAAILPPTGVLDAPGGRKAFVPETLDMGALSEQLVQGNDHAFRLWHDYYVDRLYHLALVLVRGDEQWARELLQDTMIKASRNLRRFDTELECWNWLAAIARNQFIDSWRQRRRQPTSIPWNSTEAQLDVPQPESSVQTHLHEALDRAIVHLPSEEREWIERIYFQGATQQQLAQSNQTTVKAVESKLARIRKKLKQLFLEAMNHET